MGSNVKITYTNRSINLASPKIFIFVKNDILNFDALKDGIAWKVIEKVGRESCCEFQFPYITEVCAAWHNSECKTKKLPLALGNNYIVKEDNTGIFLIQDGLSCNPQSIEVLNKVHIKGGISAQTYKAGRLLACKNNIGYAQKATFILEPKLYWGIASEIYEGQYLCSANLNSHNFFELNLESVSEVKIGLYGNAEEGFEFKVEELC